MDRKEKIFLLLTGIVVAIVMVYLVLNPQNKVKTGKELLDKITVSEETDVDNEVKKIEERIYESNLNIFIDKKDLRAAYHNLEEYRKDYPESSAKQGGYEKRINQLKTEIVNNYNNALKRTYVKEDEVQGSKFRMANIESKTIPKSLIVPYLAYSGSTPYLRFRISFYGPNGWLFFKKATFRVDEELFQYDFNYKDINRRVIYAGEVIEILDIDPSMEQSDMLSKIAKSNKTILRLQGDNYVEDRTIGDKEKQAIKDILTIYDYENNPYIDSEPTETKIEEIKVY